MLRVPDVSTIAKIPLFDGLPNEQLLLIRASLQCKRYRAGINIISAAERGEYLYIILKGTIKVHIDQVNGKDVILAILGVGHIIGEISLTDNDGLGCSATVVTLEECTLLRMTHNAFHEYRRAMPDLSFNLVRLINSRLRLANAQIQSLAALDVPARVACQILAFAREFRLSTLDDKLLIPIRLTQDDLAHMVGATRVSVGQSLADYRRRGLISVDPKTHYVTILDREALEQYCE